MNYFGIFLENLFKMTVFDCWRGARQVILRNRKNMLFIVLAKPHPWVEVFLCHAFLTYFLFQFLLCLAVCVVV